MTPSLVNKESRWMLPFVLMGGDKHDHTVSDIHVMLF